MLFLHLPAVNHETLGSSLLMCGEDLESAIGTQTMIMQTSLVF